METTLRAITTLAAAVFVVLLAALAVPAVASAQTSVDVESIVDGIEADGRFLEAGVVAEAEAAIDRANAQGVAFVRLDNGEQTSAIAEAVFAEMKERGSQYGAVVVLTNGSVFPAGVAGTSQPLDDPVTDLFAAGDIAGGIDQYLSNLGNAAAGGLDAPSSSGGGFPWILPIILAIGAFLLFNMWRGRRKTSQEEAKSIEDDRLEIIEQLKANADRVIDLGDEVITEKDPELISIYEEASAAYQNVSNEIRNATTAAEVDALDDQIDKAEWQFEVIEARLTGQTPPPFLDSDREPATTAPAPAPSTPPPPSPRSASPSERDAELHGRRRQPRPLPRRNPRQRQEPRRRSGMGGMFGKMAMSVLISMLMGGRLGQPRSSRRSQRRTGGGYGGINMPF